MGFSANEVSNILHLLKLRVQLLYKETVGRQPRNEKRTVLLTVSSHISQCSKLYTCVQRLECTDQIFLCQSLTKLSLQRAFPEGGRRCFYPKTSYLFLLKYEYPFPPYPPQNNIPLRKISAFTLEMGKDDGLNIMNRN